MVDVKLFKHCVTLKPNGKQIEGTDKVQKDWPHSLPDVEKYDRETAYLIRTDEGVEKQYSEWILENN
jgi:hypothetical protein